MKGKKLVGLTSRICKRLVLFIDTNIIFQCKPLDQLVWTSFGYKEILLIIPRQVLAEVDKGKRSSNNRISKRAKDFSSAILSNLDQIEEVFCVKEKSPQISITVTSGLPFGESPPITLNLNIPDNHITFEMILYQNAHPEIEIGLLTGDSLLRITAKQHGFKVFDIPKDWFLPPEPDENNKKIAQLEEKIKQLENDSPSISFELELEGKPLEEGEYIEIPFKEFSPLSDDEVESLITVAKNRFPLKDFNVDPSWQRLGMIWGLIPPDNVIQNYQNKEYPEWIQSLKKYLENIHRYLMDQNNLIEFDLLLMNKGFSHANSTILEILANGNIVLVSEKPVGPNIPIPPKPPLKYIQDLARSPGLNVNLRSFLPPSLGPSRQRDPYKFYWYSEKPTGPQEKWKFSCKEFRHQQEPERFTIRVQTKPDSHKRSGLIIFKVSASNLPNIASSQIQIKIKVAETIGNTLGCAKEQIDTLEFPSE